MVAAARTEGQRRGAPPHHPNRAGDVRARHRRRRRRGAERLAAALQVADEGHDRGARPDDAGGAGRRRGGGGAVGLRCRGRDPRRLAGRRGCRPPRRGALGRRRTGALRRRVGAPPHRLGRCPTSSPTCRVPSRTRPAWSTSPSRSRRAATGDRSWWSASTRGERTGSCCAGCGSSGRRPPWRSGDRTVTSLARLDGGGAVGLGYLRADVEPGTVVDVAGAPATVLPLLAE